MVFIDALSNAFSLKGIRTLDDLNDRRFVDKLRKGDTRAFQILFDRFVPKLRMYLAKQFNLPFQDADELAADTMFKVHKSITTYNPDGGAKLGTWITEIGRNTTLDYLRKQKVQMTKASAFEAADVVQTQARSLGTSRFEGAYEMDTVDDRSREITPQLAAALRAFGSLSQSDQDILRMRAVMEYDEIADGENIKVGAVRTRYNRAYERLQIAYEKETKDGRG